MKIDKILPGLIFLVVSSIHQILGQEQQPSLDMRISFAPSPVMIDGKSTVYYELYLTNLGNNSIRIKKLEVFSPADSTLVASFSKEDLDKRYQRMAVTQTGDKRIMSSGGSEIIYLEYVLPDVPKQEIAHRLEYEMPGSKDHAFYSSQGAVINLLRSKPQLILGSPLRDGPWVAIYEPSWERGHRRVIYTVDGKARIPGRFAIDFIKLDKEGNYARGDNDQIKNWYGYGEDVLSVADGVVLSTRDNFVESPTVSAHPKYSSDKATGNYIAIDIGNGNIAFYEHLKPGSINVKPGQRIRRGDIIASLGFTGQTTGPHLHFHVADANSPLGAEGIPFAFENFTQLGSYDNLENFGKMPWIKNSNERKVKGERPAPNTVITF